MVGGFEHRRPILRAKRIFAVITISVASLILIGCQHEPGVISGLVLDELTGQPVANATIIVSGQTLQTDADGTFQLRDVKPGSYRIEVQAPNYEPVNTRVTVGSGQTIVVKLKLTPLKTVTLTYAISGQITLNNRGLSGVTVTLSGTQFARTITDSSGDYSLSGLQNGTYTITPSKPGYTFNPPNRSVTISNSDVLGQDFIAALVEEVGEPSKGCTVTLKPGESIQNAIDGASPKDVICLEEGGWPAVRNLLIVKSLTLRGSGSGRSVIKGVGGLKDIHIKSIGPEIEVRIENLTVNGGILVGDLLMRPEEYGKIKLIIQNSRVLDLSVEFSDLNLINSTVGNVYFREAGLSLRGSSGIIKNSTVLGLVASVGPCKLTITDSKISGPHPIELGWLDGIALQADYY